MRTKKQKAAATKYGQFTYALAPSQKQETRENYEFRNLTAMDYAADKLIKETERELEKEMEL